MSVQVRALAAFVGSWSIGCSLLCAQPTPIDASEKQVNTEIALTQCDPSIALDPAARSALAWMSWYSEGDQSGDSIRATSYSPNASQLPLDFQVNTVTNSQQERPVVVADAEGNFVVAWDSAWSAGGDQSSLSIQFRRFAPGGSAYDPADVQANAISLTSQERPSIASDLEGNFILAWQSRRSAGNDDSGTSIQARRFRADGSPLDGMEFQVNAYTTSFQMNPEVSVGPSGEFIVVWESQLAPGDWNYAVLGRRFDENGEPLDPEEFQVNALSDNAQRIPTVERDAEGAFVVAWQSYGSSGNDGSSYSVQARRYAADGTPLDPSEFQVNTVTSSYQVRPEVALDAEGNFVVAWESWSSAGGDDDASSVQLRRYRLSGEAIDAEELQANTLTTNLQGYPSIALSEPGEASVVWCSDESYGDDDSLLSIQARRFGTRPMVVTTTEPGPTPAECSLVDAILAANTGIASGGCPAGNGGATIELPPGATISIGAPFAGLNGLPVVESTIYVKGHGATIEREGGLACPLGPEFRLLEVADGALLTLEEVTLRNGCVPFDEGGAVLVSGGTLNLRRATIEGNEAGRGGGVAFVDGTFSALESTVRGNLAASGGGGIATSGAVPSFLLRGSTVSENAAPRGAGLLVEGDAYALLRHATLSGNDATTGAGGLEVASPLARVVLDFVTVSDNASAAVSGLLAASGEVFLHDSLVGDPWTGPDCGGSPGVLTASGANLDTDGTCAALAGGAVSTVPSLLLAPLGEQGGWTRAHLPLAGSPALDAAPACEARSGAWIGADQRDYPRPSDDDGDLDPECDLGAIERGPLFADGFATGSTVLWSQTVP